VLHEHGILFAAEPLAQGRGDFELVFDHQHPRGRRSVPSLGCQDHFR
jgi:hypothetical protein